MFLSLVAPDARCPGRLHGTPRALVALLFGVALALGVIAPARAQRIVYAGTFEYELRATHTFINTGYRVVPGGFLPGDTHSNFVIAQNYAVPQVTVTYVGGAGSRVVSLDDIVLRRKSVDSRGRLVLEYRDFNIKLASNLPELGRVFEFAASTPVIGQRNEIWRTSFPWREVSCNLGGSAERWRPEDTQNTGGRFNLSGSRNAMFARIPSTVVASIQASFLRGDFDFYPSFNPPPSVLTIPGDHVIRFAQGRTVFDYRNPDNYRFVITCSVYRRQYSD